MFLDSNAWSPDDPTTGGDCSLVPLHLSGIDSPGLQCYSPKVQQGLERTWIMAESTGTQKCLQFKDLVTGTV